MLGLQQREVKLERTTLRADRLIESREHGTADSAAFARKLRPKTREASILRQIVRII